MPTANKYFALEGAKVVYNGQYSTRGLISDVFTSSIKAAGKDGTEGQSSVSWYFSTNRTQVVENQNVEKNVLLRMVIRPQATEGKEGVVAMNFYNFAKEEPNTLKFDLTGCYNDSSRKNLVLTFPAIDLLRGSEKRIRNHVHQAIKDATGISTQRIFVSKVAFSGQYMFAEFTIIANPPAMEKTSKKDEVSLDIAFAKLRESISDKSFKVRIPTKEKVVNLMPEPNGLNEFAGDRNKDQATPHYKEGSVIALTIGMLVLGFILGGVTLNLAVSRKFGVSLFQKKKYGDSPFDNPLGESSM
ncbi:uncharacterized protein LOC118184111 [Stegodyphus dumicola]|uniref:uncharacterized protein LOC118184111 n=1 Tax=Stegodyphus dumicola TaxID=202533 RepID=UPI0015A90B2A|nr:uncharacterized protein LOC118184111 [Stegodyphus dumicola]